MISVDAGALTDAAIPLGVAVGIALFCVVLRTILVTRVFSGEGERSTSVILTRLLLDPRFFPFFAFLFAFRFFLPASYGASPFLNKALFLLFTMQFIAISWRFVDIAVDRFITGTSKTVRSGSVVLKAVIAAVAFTFLLDNLGVAVSTLLVALGICGAVFAVMFRDSIANLASAATIAMTRLFSVGDAVSVRGRRGTVLSIGGIATRIQTEEGGVLVVPNRDMVTKVVTVIDTAASTLVTITVPVPRTTPTKRIEEIPTLFEQVVSDTDKAVFRHATVASVDPSMISFEVVCQVDGDRATCAAVRHNLAVQLLAALKQRSSPRKKGDVEEE
ncbi:MAG: mechanosensitive ion channel [Candidatus Kaiserbacteria bacterium]|nr:mechanosensitive ion channel [Candidatus Kaiserbacteria bacterium]